MPDVVIGFFANVADDANIISSWQPCNIKTVIPMNDSKRSKKYVISYSNGERNVEKTVPEYYLAEARTLQLNEFLKKGTRVIAKRDQAKLPFRFSSTYNHNIHLGSNSDDGFYAGIVGEQYETDDGIQCLIFFDDGHTQYISMKYIKLVFGANNNWKYAHQNARRFYSYLMNTVEDVVIDEPLYHDEIKIDFNCDWQWARVEEVDRSLIKVYFMEVNRYEWIWIGSPRIETIWRKMHKNKHLNKFTPNDLDVVELLSDDSDNEIDPQFEMTKCPNPKKLVPHQCSNKCVPFEHSVNMSKFDALQRPLITGWKRNLGKSKVSYQTPCGMSKYSLSSVRKFLIKTKSNLLIDSFTFDNNVDCYEEFVGGEYKVIDKVCVVPFSLYNTLFRQINLINSHFSNRMYLRAKSKYRFEWLEKISVDFQRILNT